MKDSNINTDQIKDQIKTKTGTKRGPKRKDFSVMTEKLCPDCETEKPGHGIKSICDFTPKKVNYSDGTKGIRFSTYCTKHHSKRNSANSAKRPVEISTYRRDYHSRRKAELLSGHPRPLRTRTEWNRASNAVEYDID